MAMRSSAGNSRRGGRAARRRRAGAGAAESEVAGAGGGGRQRAGAVGETSMMSGRLIDVADFVGHWIDSIGNNVSVELEKGEPKVTLIKPTGGHPIMLWLFFDYRLQQYRCGNGLLSETVFGQGKSAKMQSIAWVTQDGRVSSWTRAPTPGSGFGGVQSQTALRSAPPPNRTALKLPPRTSNDQTEAADRLLAALQPPTTPETSAGQVTTSEGSSANEESEPESSSPRPKAERSRQSWFDTTEEWERSGAQDFGRGVGNDAERLDESQAAGEESKGGKSRRGRRGRRRGGRGRQNATAEAAVEAW